MNDLLTKTFTAGAIINECRFVKIGAADGLVIEAVDAAVAIIGVSPNKVTASGDRIDVQILGIGKVRCDGTPARGTTLIATTGGKGAAIGAVTTGQFTGGILLTTAADEDIKDVILTPGGQANLGVT